MLFNSLIFLFGFLPVVLGQYFILGKRYRNVFLLLASLFFYAWGEAWGVLIMVSSIALNYFTGLLMSKCKSGAREKSILAVGIALNLLILVYYKYALFLTENLNALGFGFQVKDIVLPIGISFFTFQGISYLVDVYRKTVPAQKNILNIGLYISFFPQLIAGPIVRYEDIYKAIQNRTETLVDFREGLLKFIRGLAKKVLIANNVALVADKAFEIPSAELGALTAWVGVCCYALQIYFDFSGYSDMAIGLARMFGFRIKENFLHPYTSKSVKEFWRRWHISLSTWFRDYLYIPLGGNRVSKHRNYFNLIVVFFITGLWHGASWNFIIWGLFHGVFLLIEKNVNIKLPKGFQFISRLYLIIVVLVGWVFFRAENLVTAMAYIESMFNFSKQTAPIVLLYLNNYVILLFALGVLFSAPVRKWTHNGMLQIVKNGAVYTLLVNCAHLLLFAYVLLELVQSNYNPFIYFKF